MPKVRFHGHHALTAPCTVAQQAASQVCVNARPAKSRADPRDLANPSVERCCQRIFSASGPVLGHAAAPAGERTDDGLVSQESVERLRVMRATPRTLHQLLSEGTWLSAGAISAACPMSHKLTGPQVLTRARTASFEEDRCGDGGKLTCPFAVLRHCR